MHIGNAVENALHNADFLVSQGMVQLPRPLIFYVGVHAEGGAAVPLRVVLIKRDKIPAITLAAFQGVNHETVQHHDLPVFRGVLPCCVLVFVHLNLVDHRGGDHIPAVCHDEQIAPFQSGFRRFPGGVDAADPADGGKTLFLAVVNAVVDFFDAVDVTVSGDAKLKVRGGKADSDGQGAGIGNGGVRDDQNNPVNGAEVKPDICALKPSGKIDYYEPGSTMTGSPNKTITNPTGNHAWDGGKVTRPATCTEKGIRTYTCTRDPSHTKTEEIPALSHSFDGQAYVSDNNATCEQDGTKTIRCVRYGRGGCTEKDTVVDTGSMLGHSFDEEAYVSDNNATCEQDGTKTAKCVRYGTGGCTETVTVTDVGSKLGHLFEDYVSDNNATYGRDGTKTAKCVRYDQCGAINTILDVGSRLKESKPAAPLYRVIDEDGKDIDHLAEQKDGVLTITVDADVAVLTGELSGISTLVTEGVEKIVFVSKGASSAFLLSNLMEKGTADETYQLTHDGGTISFTAGGQQTDISDILVKA